MKLRALIVEDCEPMRNLLKQALPLTGLAEFEFLEAGDGQEALQKFDPQQTDILFVDCNLPRVTGIDFVRRIRGTNAEDRIPIVMVSGMKAASSIHEVLDEAGADLYITKPYTIAQLRQALEGLIQTLARSGRDG